MLITSIPQKSVGFKEHVVFGKPQPSLTLYSNPIQKEKHLHYRKTACTVVGHAFWLGAGGREEVPFQAFGFWVARQGGGCFWTKHPGRSIGRTRRRVRGRERGRQALERLDCRTLSCQEVSSKCWSKVLMRGDATGQGGGLNALVSHTCPDK